MKHSIFNYLFLFSLLAIISCGSDDDSINDIDKLEKGDKGIDKPKDGKDDCFEFIYPVQYAMPDGSTISIDGEEKDKDHLKEWYEAHPDVDAKPKLQYPIDIIFIDEVHTVSSAQELIRFKKACDKDWEANNNNCIELIYPISFTMPDGSTIKML